MQVGAFTSYIDVAQVALYLFWFFFAGLVYYLRQEDKREGYPLVNERSAHIKVQGFPPMPRPKTFLLPHGGTQTAPRTEAPEAFPAARPVAPWLGAPLDPTGNPLVDGVGPAAWVMRADEPDLGFDDNLPKIIPLRVAEGWSINTDGPDPRGYLVIAADNRVAGTVTEVWLDRSENMARYLEVSVAMATGTRQVMVPSMLATYDTEREQVKVASIMSWQFADVPTLANPDQITLREEDRISAYFGGGHLYAHTKRMGPIV